MTKEALPSIRHLILAVGCAVPVSKKENRDLPRDLAGEQAVRCEAEAIT